MDIWKLLFGWLVRLFVGLFNAGVVSFFFFFVLFFCKHRIMVHHCAIDLWLFFSVYLKPRGVLDVTVIVIGNGHGYPSSNLGGGCLHFIFCKYSSESYESNYSSSSYG